MNSSHKVFSVIKNLERFTKTKKQKEIKKSKIFKEVIIEVYNRIQNTSYGKTYKKVYNDIENGYYTYDDMIIYFLYKSIINKFKITDLTYKHIKEVRKLFTEKQAHIDLLFIINISKQLKIKSLRDFFKINVDGENIIYNLIKNKDISPIFYLQYYKKFLTNNEENNILKSNEFSHFEKLINTIFNIIKE